MEIWKDIKDYEGMYQISNMGNVRSLMTKKNLKPEIANGGYLRVNLYKDGKGKKFRVHRLVAEAFIPNPDNKPTVDHINTIVSDNRVSNLRWFTYKEQITENETTKERHYKMDSETAKRISKTAHEQRKRKVMCITTGEVFNSAVEAAIHYNLKGKSPVGNAANPNHKRKSAGKLPDGTPLIWKYIS